MYQPEKKGILFLYVNMPHLSKDISIFIVSCELTRVNPIRPALVVMNAAALGIAVSPNCDDT